MIQNLIEDPLAEAILVGRFSAGQTIVVDAADEGGLSFATLDEKTPVEAL